MTAKIATHDKRSTAVLTIKFMLFAATIAPVLLAGAMCFGLESFSVLNYLLAAAGLVTGQAAGDYFYYFFTRNHTLGTDAHTKIFAGWRPLFTALLPKRRGTLYAGIACLLIDVAIGYYFFTRFGTTILYFAAAGAAMALFFTPLMLMGFKEVVVFITFGPLSMAGIFYVLSHEVSWIPVLASLPLGCLVTIVAYLKGAKLRVVNDRGKETVVNLNRSLLTVLAFVAYLAIPALVWLKVYRLWSLAGILGIPVSFSVLKVVRNRKSEIHDYLWAVVRSIIALLLTTVLIGAGFFV